MNCNINKVVDTVLAAHGLNRYESCERGFEAFIDEILNDKSTPKPLRESMVKARLRFNATKATVELLEQLAYCKMWKGYSKMRFEEKDEEIAELKKTIRSLRRKLIKVAAARDVANSMLEESMPPMAGPVAGHSKPAARTTTDDHSQWCTPANMNRATDAAANAYTDTEQDRITKKSPMSAAASAFRAVTEAVTSKKRRLACVVEHLVGADKVLEQHQGDPDGRLCRFAGSPGMKRSDPVMVTKCAPAVNKRMVRTDAGIPCPTSLVPNQSATTEDTSIAPHPIAAPAAPFPVASTPEDPKPAALSRAKKRHIERPTLSAEGDSELAALPRAKKQRIEGPARNAGPALSTEPTAIGQLATPSIPMRNRSIGQVKLHLLAVILCVDFEMH